LIPILYSYRRCPYAMRARMALIDAGIVFEVREISLRNKPPSMLKVSPKGTVPVLVLADGTVIEQSLDIMLWAYRHHPVPHRIIWSEHGAGMSEPSLQWIKLNDEIFKKILDAYKYPERYPTQSREDSLKQALEMYLGPIETELSKKTFLMGEHLSCVDMALFPFIRQFMRCDEQQFMELPLPSILRWINYFQTSEMYLQAMVKHPTWIQS